MVFYLLQKLLEEAEKIVAESHHGGHNAELKSHDAHKVLTQKEEDEKATSEVKADSTKK